jgi:hypothetical protein
MRRASVHQRAVQRKALQEIDLRRLADDLDGKRQLHRAVLDLLGRRLREFAPDAVERHAETGRIDA